MTELLRTAYHEAGHAVVAVILGLPLRYVTLRPRTPGVAGHCVFRAGKRAVRIEDEANHLHAGPVAVARYVWLDSGEDILKEEYENGGRRDATELIALLADHAEGDEIWDRTQRGALALVERRWDAVIQVAADLASLKTVYAADIRAAVFGVAR